MKDTRVLNLQQQAAIQHGEGPLLIIAGAGTGKTTVVTERITHLILERKVDPKNILALTFTEKAAQEMQERIDIALPYGYADMWISTFHAFCDRILRNDGIHIGLNPSYKLLSTTESVLFLKRNIFNLNLSYFKPLGNPNKFLEGLLQHFSRLQDEDVTPTAYIAYANKLKKEHISDEENEVYERTIELANAYETYTQLKNKEGIMDFADLITNTLLLFRTRKSLLKEYQDKFSFMLIDEFQDTNFAQNQLAMLLAGEKQNITVVGDDDQAIYRWRGAAISNMIQFRKHFPETKIVTLTKNYRSTKNILDTSYTLIQHNNPDRLEIKENIDKKLTSARDVIGKPVKLFLATKGDAEADLVAKEINGLIKTKQYAYKDIAILVRANDHANPFIKSFERLKIPYQFLGPGQLFYQEEIKNLIAYLRVLSNFEDSQSLYRILSMDVFHISSTSIAMLLNFSKRKNLTLFETLEKVEELTIPQKDKENIAIIFSMLQKHLTLVSKETAGQILFFFLKDSKLLEKYLKPDEEASQLEMQNISRFFTKLKEFESEHDDASVFSTIEWIELSMQLGESPLISTTDWTENNGVNILTIHASKGLEFSVVFLVNLVNQRFPSRERREQIPIPDTLIKEVLPEGDFHLQEERRLFYVGITRAKDLLFLTAANLYGEGKRQRKLSPFISESLGTQAVEDVKKKATAEEQLTLLEFFPETTQKKNKEINVPVTYLSYSQIQTFEICPLHYKLKYILKIPTPLSPSQSFGMSIHAALREFYQLHTRGEKIRIDDIKDILKMYWISEGYENKAHEKESFERATTSTLAYLQKMFDPKISLIALELPFQFPVNQIKVGGRIDRIDSIGEKISIIDYKTGDNLPTEKELQENFQLSLYALAATEIHDKLIQKTPENIVLSLHFIEKQKIFTTSRTKDDLLVAKQRIIEIAKEIEISDFLCSHYILCKNCEYKMLCSSK
ncbi:MAG: ATP-dependent helicase [Candidatus Levyibacteriota bacterium]